MIFNIYRFLIYLLLPIIKLNFYLRTIKNKEEKGRLQERFGISNNLRPKGNLIWIHATSLGELNSVKSLIEKLLYNHNILLTTNTITAYQLSKKIFKNSIIHQYAPFDYEKWVINFLDHWKPNLVIWVESDLWPNTIKNISKRKIKMILLNLRISPKSINRWIYFKKFFNNLMHCFDKVYVQSEYELKKIKKLTSKDLKYIGNLKLTVSSSNQVNQNINLVKIKESKKNIILLASTHHNEEYKILKKLKEIYKKNNNFSIIVIPRHPNRTKDVFKVAKNFFPKTKIIDNFNLNIETNCSIINSLGEMPKYYQISDIVVLGGSFIDAGGHNPIEPANNKCAILTGPSLFNWQNLYDEMYEEDILIVCKNLNELSNRLSNLLIDGKLQDKYKIKALKFSEKENNILEKLFSDINPFLKEIKNV